MLEALERRKQMIMNAPSTRLAMCALRFMLAIYFSATPLPTLIVWQKGKETIVLDLTYTWLL